MLQPPLGPLSYRGRMPGACLLRGWLILGLLLCLAGATGSRRVSKVTRCPSSCYCTKDSAFCMEAKAIPRNFPPGIVSLTMVNAAFSEISEGAFSHLHLLQFLLLNSNKFTMIANDAFAGLTHLQYLFIENNDIQALSKHAFRGLKALAHLSLSNNNLQILPRDLFRHLDILTDLDLRGNTLHCDCKIKWLLEWMSGTNTSVLPVYCASPPKLQGHQLHDLSVQDFYCISSDFVVHETFQFHAVSVESYSFNGDVFVVFAQPYTGICMLYVWDHTDMVFRKHYNITSRSAVYCKPLVIEKTVYMVVAQLFGGSHIYKWEEVPQRFMKIQDIDTARVLKPNHVEAFHLEDNWFFAVADSSKAGLTTLYRWNSNGFYSYQSLHPWHRDTHVEFLEVDGIPWLILSSASQPPVVYQWNHVQRQFTLHGHLLDAIDVWMVKHFYANGVLHLCLIRFIGDSRVMRWEGQQFVEVQVLPSRGSKVALPFSVEGRLYLAMGSDYSFSRVYLWDEAAQRFQPFQELNVRGPRAFSLLSVDNSDILLVASFKGNTLAYQHLLLDLSAK
ncbi:leucine-rich repeat LGI family member 3 precursor-like [Scleropages formosus]|uniref:Leucine-rich repeat LGI family member 3-like n=2 Tax=Scleropages formosus TaxID=113540 RepID=A0A0P7TCE1_SCLFO|nr:leucine-rich repeat LGI family member 3 precursor-like [Scleropages formosus]